MLEMVPLLEVKQDFLKDLRGALDSEDMQKEGVRCTMSVSEFHSRYYILMRSSELTVDSVLFDLLY
jgi:hypothetical protein